MGKRSNHKNREWRESKDTSNQDNTGQRDFRLAHYNGVSYFNSGKDILRRLRQAVADSGNHPEYMGDLADLIAELLPRAETKHWDLVWRIDPYENKLWASVFGTHYIMTKAFLQGGKEWLNNDIPLYKGVIHLNTIDGYSNLKENTVGII